MKVRAVMARSIALPSSLQRDRVRYILYFPVTRLAFIGLSFVSGPRMMEPIGMIWLCTSGDV